MNAKWMETAFVASAISDASRSGQLPSPGDAAIILATPSDQTSSDANLDTGYVVKCVVAKMRGGAVPTPTESELLNSVPMIDLMRKEITVEDLNWIWPIIAEHSDQRFGFYISLLRLHAERPDVQTRLQDIWGGSSPYMRTQLFWRILDDPNLPADWHERLFAFVLQEWDTFHRSGAKFLGTDQELVIIRALERYGDQEWPQSKQWAYLCSAAGASKYPKAVKALLVIGTSNQDAFARKVASVLLGRLLQGDAK